MLTPQNVRDIQIEQKRPSNFTGFDRWNIRRMMRTIERKIKNVAKSNPNQDSTVVFVSGTVPQIESVVTMLRIMGFECFAEVDSESIICPKRKDFYIDVYWGDRLLSDYDKFKYSQQL